MALFFIRAHDLGELHLKCAKVLRDSPLPSPFDAETIVVADPAIRRWLGLQLADSLGIHSNVEYVAPVTWLQQAMRQTMADIPKHDPFHLQRLSWLIFSLLPAQLKQPAFASLKTYLAHDAHGVKRWQLACRIARVFDAYQDYRPDWIRRWSSGEEDHWQACLWRVLIAAVGQNNHRVAWMDAWQKGIKSHCEKPVSNHRVCWFAVEQYLPWWGETLQTLSAHRDVFVFQWSAPCSDHPLVQAWGQLQHTIRQGSCKGEQPSSIDASLQCHSCHTPMREVEVLHDALLAMLDADASLRAEDILVLIPEMSRYAPYIHVVFSEQDARPFIPWNISDVYIADEHPVIEIFFQLLSLPDSRFTQSEMHAYLDVEEITQHFSLDDEQLLIVRKTLAALQVRWGVDALHRASFDLPAWEEQSWQAAFNRLFAGYALGDNQDWQGINPAPIDTNTATALASFFALFEVLNHWRVKLNISQTGQQWQTALGQMIDDVFGQQQGTTEKVDAIRAAIDALARHAGHALLPSSVVREYLKEALQSSQQHARYFSGGVTFCALRPMRPLPFRVIALLGMHDAAFPRRDTRYEFDLMAASPQAGDANHGQIDRYTMLQTVLSASDTLYISYCGRSINNNTACQPSVLVAELLDVLPHKLEITQHAMQAFDIKNYNACQPSYNRYWATISQQIMQANQGSTVAHWHNHALDAEANAAKSLPLSTLIHFVCDPIKFFFNRRLAVYLQPAETLADDELFTLDSLQAWQVRQRILDHTQAGESINPTRLASEGLLPHGAFSAQQLSQEAAVIDTLQQHLQAYAEATTAPQRIALSFDDIDGQTIMLTGQLTGYYPAQGLMHYTASSYKPKPALRLWLEHLALCASHAYPANEQSTLLCRDATKVISVIAANEARRILHGFMVAMQEGLRRPLPVFLHASWAWANAMQKQKGDTAALAAAKTAWYSGAYHQGDEEDLYLQLAMRGVEGMPMDSPAFTQQAAQWYLPLLDKMVDK